MGKNRDSRKKSNQVKNTKISGNRLKDGMAIWLADGGRQLEVSVRALPLVFGTIIASGLAVTHLENFTILMGLVVCSSALIFVREEMAHSQQRNIARALLTVGLLVLTGAWHLESGEQRLPVLVFVIYALADQMAGFSRAPQSRFSFASQIIGLFFSLSALSVLAVYAQSQQLIFGAAIIGFVPAGLLCAARVARHYNSLPAIGINNKAVDEKRLRGGSLIYALFLLLGPAFGVIFTAAHFVPDTYLLSPLLLIRSGGLVNEIAKNPDKHQAVALKTTLLAGLAAVFMLILGLL